MVWLGYLWLRVRCSLSRHPLTITWFPAGYEVQSCPCGKLTKL